ncbi:MAG: hypothetical protein R8M14_05710 [Ghiorsea sp.]
MFILKNFILSCLYFMLLSTYAQANTVDNEVSSYFQNLGQKKATLSSVFAAMKQMPKATPTRDTTPMLMYAKANWRDLSPKTKTMLNPWFMRPTDAGATSGVSSVSVFTAAQESTYASTYFKFHYLDAATNASDPNSATLAFVQQMAAIADNVWATEIITMGYNAPPSDGGLGGDNKYDIYLLNIGGAGIYGYVTSDATSYLGTPFPNSSYSHMVIDNDFSLSQFGYTDPLVPAKVTLAHEFFHSIQNGYDTSEFPAFFESLSTWMEDKVYPTIKDNLQYIGETFTDSNGDGQYSTGEPFTDRNGNNLRELGSQDYPELHLDSFGLSKTSLEQYGRFLWIRYISDKFGDAAVKSILTATGNVAGNNTYSAINTVLTNSYASSLAAAFHEFGTWNIDTSLYTNGTDYPIAWGDNLFNNGAINISSNASKSLQPFSGKQKHLSTIYELVNNPSGTYTFTTDGSALVTAMVQTTTGGAYSSQAIALSAGQGSWAAPTGITKATFVISNTSPTSDTMTWQLTDGVTAPLAVLASTNNGATNISVSSSNSGGCLIPTPTSLPHWLWLFLFFGLLLTYRKSNNTS